MTMPGIFQLGSKDPYIVLIQRALNELGHNRLVRDGALGPMGVNALKAWQTQSSLPADGIYAGQTAKILDEYIAKRFITQKDYTDAAAKIGCAVSAVKAVKTVETSGEGFLPNAQVTILFERHVFKKQLDQKLAATPDLVNSLVDKLGLKVLPGMNKVAYVQATIASKYDDVYNSIPGGYSAHSEDEYTRMNKAAELDLVCAMSACSWGLFQIMGYHASLLGYASVVDMVNAYKLSERAQLMSFCDFVLKDVALTNALRTKNWAQFALRYNGSNYTKNQYDIKLAAADQANA